MNGWNSRGYWGTIVRINESLWYIIQIDESTSVDNKATVLVSVWVIFQEDVHEDMLWALSLAISTTAAELFKTLNDYISGKLNWLFCVAMCTDGVTAMTGWLSGFTTQVKEVASVCESVDCVVHREMLINQKSHLNLTTFCRMWLTWSTTLMYMPLTHVCSQSSVKRWKQSTHVSSNTEWEDFLKADHWPEFLS